MDGFAHGLGSAELLLGHVDLQRHQLLDGLLYLQGVGPDLGDVQLRAIVVFTRHQRRRCREQPLV
ncbi:hypothetical protein D3C71_1959250 [compost metagenome]